MQKPPISKYRPFEAVDLPDRQWPARRIEKAPYWCSVDLRDGNQALEQPMNVFEKLRFFEALVDIGFREIEVGFPSAAQVEFDFLRTLIDEDRIPQGVAVQVLVQAREHLILRTIESLRGVPGAIFHFYNSTSPAQRDITFNLSREAVKKIAVEAAVLIKSQLAKLEGSDIRIEYSPESFSSTEMDYALEVCEAVMDVIEPTVDRPIILNLPATVEVATPNHHADQIEWFCRNLKERDKAIISLHTHNDRGTGVAATELGLLAGADRVEGTLFGNGERTGNLDIVTVALNMYSQGIHPGLDFSNLPAIREIYETCTRMTVHPRHPYGGDLVFTAFSGSHQDAIKKGFDRRAALPAENKDPWNIPYLAIDPADIGRTYEAIIRINSQSGKGGVAHVLARDFGLNLPKSMYPEVGTVVSGEADRRGTELDSQEIYDIFRANFVNLAKPIGLLEHEISRGHGENRSIRIEAKLAVEGKEQVYQGEGNGPINALVHALESAGLKNFTLQDYLQHAIGHGSATSSSAYILVQRKDKKLFWGCGIDTNIEVAGMQALISAVNRAAGV